MDYSAYPCSGDLLVQEHGLIYDAIDGFIHKLHKLLLPVQLLQTQM